MRSWSKCLTLALAVLAVLWLRGGWRPVQEKSSARRAAPAADAPSLPDTTLPDAMREKLADAMQADDAKETVRTLQQLVHEAGGSDADEVYRLLLYSAEAGGLTEHQVREHVDAWLSGAESIGAERAAACRIEALQVLRGKKCYSQLALELARQAAEEVADDAPLDRRAAVAGALADAARLAGNDELSAQAGAELAELDRRLDEEYAANVPPFEPEIHAGREDAAHGRAVLFELFSGAQCPVCVATDVAFDALLATYQPAQLVALQYHVHVPGPDPLATPDSIHRSQYYSLRGAPAALVNGVLATSRGGLMAQSKAKYDEFRRRIDLELATPRAADIELDVERSGDTILVKAAASAAGPPAASGESTLRLRVALTEEKVRYVGGNQLRFHHHVVRAFPGGVAGKALVDGAAGVDLTIDLEQLRGELTAYLDDFAKAHEFPAARPVLDFNGLAVVAFVQDDDKRVLHASQAPVPAP